MFGCVDGAECEGYTCCAAHGGQAKCPPNLPVMCKQKACKVGDYCCDMDCNIFGGVRPCLASTGLRGRSPQTAPESAAEPQSEPELQQPVLEPQAAPEPQAPAVEPQETPMEPQAAEPAGLESEEAEELAEPTMEPREVDLLLSDSPMDTPEAPTPRPRGPREPTLQLRPAASAGPFPSLFCFCVMRATGYEPALVQAQFEKGIGIFACNEHVILTDASKHPLPEHKVLDIQNGPQAATGDTSNPGVTTTSFLNTKIFLEAWDKVIEDGRLFRHNWVVKADPDAIFFPERLRGLLGQHSARDLREQPRLYFPNCARTFGQGGNKAKLFGSLEVFSVTAVKAYADDVAKCKASPWHGWGEDFYMQNCMDMLGVQPANDIVGKIGDKRCYAAPCVDKSKVAFHDFKDVGSYMACYSQATS